MNLFGRNDKPGEARSGEVKVGDAPANDAKTGDIKTGEILDPAPPKPHAPQAMPMPATIDAAAKAPPSSTKPTPAKTGDVMASVISKALKITGELESTEDIQIDGQIEGDVRGVGVKIGQNARVKGTVYGDEVELAGTVEGRIESKKVTLSGTARMTGDVFHQDIKIESGAYINGSLKPDMGKPDSRASDSRADVKQASSKPASASIVTPAPKDNATATAHH